MRAAVNAPAPASPAVSAAEAGKPSSLEGYFLVLGLAILVSMPFLLKGQPNSLGSAEEMGITSDQGDATKQLVLAMLYAGFGVMLLWKARLPALLALGGPLLLLVGWCGMSALWSDVPSLTLRRFAALAGTVVIGLYAGVRFDFEELERLLCRVVAVVLLASIAVALLAPSMGLDAAGRLRGVLSHKNTFAAFAGFGLVMVLARATGKGWRRETALEIATVVACLASLILARSAAPLPTVGFALLILFWVRHNRGASSGPVAVALALAYAAGLVLPMIAGDLGGLANALGRDSDFSGRTLVWDFGTDLLSRNPLLGYGYGVFWNGPAGTLFLRWAHFAVPHAHNGFLQLALDVGVVGVALFFSALAFTTIRAVRLLNAGELEASWPLAFVAFYVVSNFAESRLWDGNDLLTALFVAVVVRINLLAGKALAKRSPRPAVSGSWKRTHG